MVLEFSPKNLTASSNASCGKRVGTRSDTGVTGLGSQPDGAVPDLRDLGVVLQLLQLGLAVGDELLQHRVVAVHAVLPLGQLHAPVQLLHVQQDVLQRHCGGGDEQVKFNRTFKPGDQTLCDSPAAAFST